MRPLFPLMSEQIALDASRREDRVPTDPVRLGTGSARPGQHGSVADVVAKRAGAPAPHPDAATSQI
jgi:hypothetical protein